MTFNFNLGKKVVDFLKQNTEEKFTARQIATYINDTYSEECKAKQQRSKAIKQPIHDTKTLINQLVAEIGTQKLQQSESRVKITEGRPRRYYFTSQSDIAEVIEAEVVNNTKSTTNVKNKLTERELYPVVCKYLYHELNIYPKIIDDKCSSNMNGINGNKWLHPDIVALEDLSRDWEDEIKACVKHYFDKQTKLWSFEVKKLINRSNLREAFFQCVSNSSWANFSYLVTESLDNKSEKELEILSNLHGIGVICINTQNHNESYIHIHAKEKSQIDWDTINRLAKENRDFVYYVQRIRHFYQTGNISHNDWDIAI